MIEALRALFQEAVGEFLARDRRLLDNDTNERCLCARLAMYLEDAARREDLRGYYADVDYNRNRGDVKRIIGREPGQHIPIIADLILHSRAEQEDDNLLAIELKKSTRLAVEKNNDRHRLAMLTMPAYDVNLWPNQDGLAYVYGYKLGLFVEINARTRLLGVEEFIGGKSTGAYTIPF